jgi:hypothetical protein
MPEVKAGQAQWSLRSMTPKRSSKKVSLSMAKREKGNLLAHSIVNY